MRARRALRRMRAGLARAAALAGRTRRRTLGALRRRWRGALRVAVVGAIVIAGAIERAPIAHWALTHPYFAVSEIVVSPTRRVREGVLLQWVGLRPGMSIWTLEPRALERRLEEHPGSGARRVERELPRRADHRAWWSARRRPW